MKLQVHANASYVYQAYMCMSLIPFAIVVPFQQMRMSAREAHRHVPPIPTARTPSVASLVRASLATGS